MARKNVLTYELVGGQSLSSSFTTSPTQIVYLDNCSYQINITTTDSIGTFAVQGSNDYQSIENVITNPGNWIALTLGGGTPFVNASNDNIIIDLNQLPFSAIRLAYTSGTAGTGTCNIYLTCKQVGG
jgi:hypothetical protein